MTKTPQVVWLTTSVNNPPKNQWVLMSRDGEISMGRWLGNDNYEFFDGETQKVILIKRPTYWATVQQRRRQPNREFLELSLFD